VSIRKFKDDGEEREFTIGGDRRLYRRKDAKEESHDSLPDFMKRFYDILTSGGGTIF
jgi:hypothetical protein